MNQSKSFLLVYGSETGQAQAIAEQIVEKSAEFGLQANLHCLNETDKEFNIEKESCVVMVTSTTGDGDAPENASKFLRKIKNKTFSHDYLSHLHYSILGLGDTNYNNFCKCGRDMDSRLEQLGAKRFYPTGLADDGVGLEIVVDPWLEGLYPALKKFLEQSDNKDSPVDPLSEHMSEIVSDNYSQNDLKQSNSELSVNHSSLNGDSVEVIVDRIQTGNDSVGAKTKSDLNENNNSSTLNGKESVMDLIENNVKDASNSSGDTGNNVEDILDTVEKWTLSDSRPSLADKDLTIPLLAPEFLLAKYSQQTYETDNLTFQNGCKLPSANSDIIYAGVLNSKVLTHPDALKKTLLLRLILQDQDKHFSPGDSISIICQNSEREVQLLLERLKALHLSDQQVCLSLIPGTKKRRAAVPPHIHPTTTLKYIFKTCVNIRDVPSKALIRMLVEYTTDEKEKRCLQELCSKEGAYEYTKSLREKCVSLLDLLYAFQSCLPPVERVLEFLPRLLPRPYSICNCPETNPQNIDIVFNVVDIQRDVSKGHYYSRLGVCTGWMDDITSSLQKSETDDDSGRIKIPIFFRTNQHFQPSSDLSKPLVLIGPGTGVAPFIGFLQQRVLFKSRACKEDKYGDTWVFTGCRHKDKDYLFREDLEDFLASGIISRLFVSFSRDPDSKHRYVQDYMKSECENLVRLLVDEEALVYVCGDAKNMAKDVSAAFQEILVLVKSFSTDEANAFMMRKRLHKTYLEDVWT